MIASIEMRGVNCRPTSRPATTACANCSTGGPPATRYPFTNCTNCGPRATIIYELPYDRERTVMQSFPLCDPCAAEYVDPTNPSISCRTRGVRCVRPAIGLAADRLGHETGDRRGGIASGDSCHRKRSNCRHQEPRWLPTCVRCDKRGRRKFAARTQAAAGETVGRHGPRQAAVHVVARPSVTEDRLLTSGVRPIVLVEGMGVLPAVVSRARAAWECSCRTRRCTIFC